MIQSKLEVVSRVHHRVLNDHATKHNINQRWVQWVKPTPGEIKLNTNGSRNNLDIAAFGGLLRDDQGIWLSGFSGKLGIVSVLSAELHGIKHGLL